MAENTGDLDVKPNVQDEKPEEQQPELTDKEKLDEQLKRFENIQNDSLQSELLSLAETIKTKFKLEHDKTSLEIFLSNAKSAISKKLEQKLTRVEIPAFIAQSKLGEKYDLESKGTDVTYGDLATLIIGSAIGFASSTKVKAAFYHVTGIGGVGAAAFAGAVFGTARAVVTEGLHAKDAYSGENWREQINQMEKPESRLRAIELLIKDKDFKKHLKANASEAVDFVTMYGEIAASVEEDQLQAILDRRQLSRGMPGVENYIEKTDKETKKRLFRAIGQGAIRGAVVGALGYEAAKGIEWVFDKVATFASGVVQEVRGLPPLSVMTANAGELPPATGHIWHTGTGDTGHLNIDSHGHLQGESIVQVDDKLVGGVVHNADIPGATNHEVAKQVSDALAKDNLLNTTQKGLFEGKLTELLSKEHAGSFASGETVRISAHTLNTALEQSGAHLDKAAIGGLPIVGAPVSPEAPETPKPSEPAQPIKPEVPANPPGNSTPLSPTPPNVQPGIVPGPPGSATPLSPAGPPAPATGPNWFNRTEHFLQQNEKNIGHGAAWVGLIASAALAVVGAVRLRRYVKEDAKNQERIQKLLTEEYKVTDPEMIVKDLEFLSSYDKWENNEEEIKGDEAFKAVLGQFDVNLPYIAPTEEFQNWLKNDTNYKDISWKINPEVVYLKGKKWIGVVGGLGAKITIRPDSFWENFSIPESTPMPKEPQYADDQTRPAGVEPFNAELDPVATLDQINSDRINNHQTAAVEINRLSDRLYDGLRVGLTINGQPGTLVGIERVNLKLKATEPLKTFEFVVETGGNTRRLAVEEFFAQTSGWTSGGEAPMPAGGSEASSLEEVGEYDITSKTAQEVFDDLHKAYEPLNKKALFKILNSLREKLNTNPISMTYTGESVKLAGVVFPPPTGEDFPELDRVVFMVPGQNVFGLKEFFGQCRNLEFMEPAATTEEEAAEYTPADNNADTIRQDLLARGEGNRQDIIDYLAKRLAAGQTVIVTDAASGLPFWTLTQVEDDGNAMISFRDREPRQENLGMVASPTSIWEFSQPEPEIEPIVTDEQRATEARGNIVGSLGAEIARRKALETTEEPTEYEITSQSAQEVLSDLSNAWHSGNQEKCLEIVDSLQSKLRSGIITGVNANQETINLVDVQPILRSPGADAPARISEIRFTIQDKTENSELSREEFYSKTKAWKFEEATESATTVSEDTAAAEPATTNTIGEGATETSPTSEVLDEIEAMTAQNDIAGARTLLESTGLTSQPLIFPEVSHKKMASFFERVGMKFDLQKPFNLEINDEGKFQFNQDKNTRRFTLPKGGVVTLLRENNVTVAAAAAVEPTSAPAPTSSNAEAPVKAVEYEIGDTPAEQVFTDLNNAWTAGNEKLAEAIADAISDRTSKKGSIRFDINDSSGKYQKVGRIGSAIVDPEKGLIFFGSDDVEMIPQDSEWFFNNTSNWEFENKDGMVEEPTPAEAEKPADGGTEQMPPVEELKPVPRAEVITQLQALQQTGNREQVAKFLESSGLMARKMLIPEKLWEGIRWQVKETNQIFDVTKPVSIELVDGSTEVKLVQVGATIPLSGTKRLLEEILPETITPSGLTAQVDTEAKPPAAPKPEITGRIMDNVPLAEEETETNMTPANALETLGKLDTSDTDTNTANNIIRQMLANGIDFTLSEEGLRSFQEHQEEEDPEIEPVIDKPVRIELTQKTNDRGRLYRVTQENWRGGKTTAWIEAEAVANGLVANSEEPFELRKPNKE